jgi:hypothetical protein
MTVANTRFDEMVPVPVSTMILPSVGRLASEKQAQPAF